MDKTKLNEIYEKVYFKMLNFISYRIRSEKEIADRLDKYLSKYRYSDTELEDIRSHTVSKLEEAGYLSDAVFASTYIKGLISSRKPISQIKITQFLSKKGIDKDTIAEVLKELPPDFLFESALKDGEKKLRLLKSVDKYTAKRKLSEYLYRKGYPFETIHSVIDSLL